MLWWSLSGHKDSYQQQLLVFRQLHLRMLNFNSNMQSYKIRLHKDRSGLLVKIEIIWIATDGLRGPIWDLGV